MAHELGHNLGASHDGEAGTSCASVGGGFIMAPSVCGYSRRSRSCSLDSDAADDRVGELRDAGRVRGRRHRGVDRAAVTGEGGVAVHAALRREVERQYRDAGCRSPRSRCRQSPATPSNRHRVHWAVARSRVSPRPARSARWPRAITHSITINARGSAAQSFTVQARVAASNDRVTSNNNRTLAVAIRSGIDAAVALSASASRSRARRAARNLRRRQQPARAAAAQRDAVGQPQPVGAPRPACRAATCTRERAFR